MRATACRHAQQRNAAIQFIGGRYPNTRRAKDINANSPVVVCKPHMIYADHVVFPKHHGGPQPGAISISNTGHIDNIYPSFTELQAKLLSQKLNIHLTSFANDESNNNNIVLSPGLIDVHCHISELGRNWEGYHTATRAASAGGITTLMGMPLNSLPPTTTVDAFDMEIKASCNVQMMSDVGLWGGAVPSNTSTNEGQRELKNLLDAGAFGLKAFLAPLPPSAGYETVSPSQLDIAASICGTKNKPLLVHSELMTQQEQDDKADEAYEGSFDKSYETHVASRPGKWEQEAVEVVCRLVDKCHMHIVHLSDAGCLDIIQRTKQQLRSSNPTAHMKGNLTVETCPHYLLFNVEHLPHVDTRYKCFPPIRHESNNAQLWQRGLLTISDTGNDNSESCGPLIDMIASDHSPCTSDMRLMDTAAGDGGGGRRDLRKAWGGLSGLQYQLQSTITALERDNNQHHPIEQGGGDDSNTKLRQNMAQIAQWWSTAPSQLVPGLSSLKGCIDIGYQADLSAYDATYIGKPNSYSREHHRWKGGSVYPNMELNGRVICTWLRGICVYDGESDTHVEEENYGVGSIMLHREK